MKSFVRPLLLGKKILPSNVFYSPLAGCSDFPFRKMASYFRPGLIYCEMVKMDAVVRHDQGTYHILDYDGDMHPIGAQLCGSKPSIAGEAAKIIEDLGFDVLDLNCGCPVDKVTKDGSGSGLLKQPLLIGEIIAKMVAAVRIPVTVKIRAGWDDEHIIAEQVTRIAEEAGAQAIAIHARTREQGYKGPAQWEYIRASKQAAKTIKVIGNGDVIDAEAGLRMFKETGCDAILASRGTMGQPWLAEDIYRLDKGESLLPKTVAERRQALLEHFQHTLQYHSERRVIIDMRRVGCWYFPNAAKARDFRCAISKASTIKEIEELILYFPFDEAKEKQLSISEACIVREC